MGRKKRTPGIYERGNKWIVNTTYKYHRIWETCATEEMAETNLRKVMTLIDEGRYLEKKRQPKETLGHIGKRYIEWVEAVGQKDVRSKKCRLEVLKGFFGKDTPIAAITRARIEEFQTWRKNTKGESGRIPAPATVNREVALIKHMLTKAVEWGILVDNPARRIKLFREDNRRLRFLTPREIKALLEACSPTLRRIVLLALHTGMRKGEILNLVWDNVNLRERFIELLDQKNGERSTIPLNQTAIDTLRSIPRRLDSKYVFPGKTPDKPFYDLKRQFEKAVTKAGLEGVTFHVLRHTCASHLVMAGVDLATVKEIMRHKSIEMTLRYSHLSPAHKKSAVDALESALTAAEEEAENRA